jgi:hypothetical protein
MPVTDPYASAAEYRAHIGKTEAAQDTSVILPALLAVSRLLDKQTGRFFTRDAAGVARVFSGIDNTRLYLPDIATLTGLAVKADLNADFDYVDADETLTINTHFFAGPENPDKGPEPQPWRWLDIVPNNGRLDKWRRFTWEREALQTLRFVEVTAAWGWPAVPGAIREATILITREILDLEQSGFSLALQNIDTAVNLAPTAFSIVQRIKREYGNQALFV